MTITEKYKSTRHLIRNGDFILFSGTGIIANIIKASDNSKMSHIGIVVEIYGRLLIVDSNIKGNHPEWLSTRVESYTKHSDFCILRSTRSINEIDNAISEFMIQSDEERTRYDLINGIKELLNRKFGFNIKIKLIEGHNICSMSVRKTSNILKMMYKTFEDKIIVLPEDFLRYRDVTNTILLFNQ